MGSQCYDSVREVGEVEVEVYAPACRKGDPELVASWDLADDHFRGLFLIMSAALFC
jgi:hypothetical protein